MTDEPDASKAHVRICGSPGRATARGDPATRPRARRNGLAGNDLRVRGEFAKPHRQRGELARRRLCLAHQVACPGTRARTTHARHHRTAAVSTGFRPLVASRLDGSCAMPGSAGGRQAGRCLGSPRRAGVPRLLDCFARVPSTPSAVSQDPPLAAMPKPALDQRKTSKISRRSPRVILVHVPGGGVRSRPVPAPGGMAGGRIGRSCFVSCHEGVSGGWRDECSQGQAGAPLREKKFVSLACAPFRAGGE
jgi:hypothetical protein